MSAVIDRAIQVYGAAGMSMRLLNTSVSPHASICLGLTDDTPLSFMYRTARFARFYDGPDEVSAIFVLIVSTLFFVTQVHMGSVPRNVLRIYNVGDTWDFGTR